MGALLVLSRHNMRSRLIGRKPFFLNESMRKKTNIKFATIAGCKMIKTEAKSHSAIPFFFQVYHSPIACIRSPHSHAPERRRRNRVNLRREHLSLCAERVEGEIWPFSFFPPRIFTQVTQGGLCQILSKRCHAGPGSEDLCKLIQPALKVNLDFFSLFSTN